MTVRNQETHNPRCRSCVGLSMIGIPAIWALTIGVSVIGVSAIGVPRGAIGSYMGASGAHRRLPEFQDGKKGENLQGRDAQVELSIGRGKLANAYGCQACALAHAVTSVIKILKNSQY